MRLAALILGMSFNENFSGTFGLDDHGHLIEVATAVGLVSGLKKIKEYGV